MAGNGKRRAHFLARNVCKASNNEKGQTMVEFVVPFIIIIALLLFITDISIMTYAWGVLEYSAGRGARQMRQSVSPADIAAAVEAHAEALGIDIQPGEITVAVNANTITVDMDVTVELFALGAFWFAYIPNTGGGVQVRVREVVRVVPNLTE